MYQERGDPHECVLVCVCVCLFVLWDISNDSVEFFFLASPATDHLDLNHFHLSMAQTETFSWLFAKSMQIRKEKKTERK